jgi:hypothetical protein
VEYVDEPEAAQYAGGLVAGGRTRRASHVWPAGIMRRLAFRVLRVAFGERGVVAGWTRRWRGEWVVQVIGGERLGPFLSRDEAIAAEIAYLNERIV